GRRGISVRNLHPSSPCRGSGPDGFGGGRVPDLPAFFPARRRQGQGGLPAGGWRGERPRCFAQGAGDGEALRTPVRGGLKRTAPQGAGIFSRALPRAGLLPCLDDQDARELFPPLPGQFPGHGGGRPHRGFACSLPPWGIASMIRLSLGAQRTTSTFRDLWNVLSIEDGIAVTSDPPAVTAVCYFPPFFLKDPAELEDELASFVRSLFSLPIDSLVSVYLVKQFKDYPLKTGVPGKHS